MRLVFCLFLSLVFLTGLDAEAPKMYLPGDIVHLVVGAPPDTVQIIAEVPDGTRINMDFERRTYSWYAHWEIPYGFKKGSYHAKLIATDVTGTVFTGDTNTFYVGEPALVTLIRLGETKEAKPERPLAREKVELKAKPEPVKKAAPPPAKKKKPVYRPPLKAKLKKETPATKEDKNLARMRLLMTARENIDKRQYKEAKGQLKALLSIDPKNNEIRSMLYRIDVVIKTKEH